LTGAVGRRVREEKRGEREREVSRRTRRTKRRREEEAVDGCTNLHTHPLKSIDLWTPRLRDQSSEFSILSVRPVNMSSH